MFYLTESKAGFFSNMIIFYIQIYAHYLISFRYFLNEYYMCAILHYMSYDSVQNSARKTIQKWSEYHRRRDIFIIVYQIGATLLLVCLGLTNFIVLLRKGNGHTPFEHDSNKLSQVYGDKIVYLVLESSCTLFRFVIVVIFITAMVRMSMAKKKAKRMGYKHIVKLPSCCNLS